MSSNPHGLLKTGCSGDFFLWYTNWITPNISSPLLFQLIKWVLALTLLLESAGGERRAESKVSDISLLLPLQQQLCLVTRSVVIGLRSLSPQLCRFLHLICWLLYQIRQPSYNSLSLTIWKKMFL